jgi:class 3 adenylate cyclase
MNLYVTEGQFYSDIMFNCLAFVFAINLCLFGLYSYGCMTPTLARISEDILISERMFSLVPIRFLTTDSRIRKFLNLQIFEQQELEVEKAQKEAEFYRKILGNSNQPIILFERSMGQVLITKMNDVAMHLFECHDDMVGLPLITLFPNQAGVITRYIQSIQSDPKLFPQEIEIQGRGSSGKILFLLASFGQVNSEVSVCHLKVQPKNLHDIIQERERMIKSLQYETIPAEYRNRLQSGERSIYHYVSDLTMVACDLGDLDKLVLARSDEDKSVIYNAVFSVLEELADQFKLHQIPTPGNQFICLGEIGDHIEPGTQPENVVNFAEAAIKAIHVLNLQLPVSIALHFGGGMVGIRGKYREGERTRFAIDVYGDVVRELALLVDMCSPCQVVVSPEFYQVAPIDRKFRETEGVYEMLVMESKLDGITESPLLKTFQRDFDEHGLEF